MKNILIVFTCSIILNLTAVVDTEYFKYLELSLESNNDADSSKICLTLANPAESGFSHYFKFIYERDPIIDSYGVGYKVSKWFNSYISSQIDFEAIKNESFSQLTIVPELQTKPIGNLHLGLRFPSKIVVNENKKETELLTSFYSKIFINKHLYLFYQNTDGDIHELKLSKRFGNFELLTGALFYDELSEDPMLMAGFEFNFGKSSIKSYHKNDTKSFSYSGISLRQEFGKYTLPKKYEADLFPVVKEYNPRFGLVVENEAGFFKESEIKMKIRKGDNLYRLSRRLPKNADPYYKGNVKAITEYNNIKNPEKIYVGQVIKIPVNVEIPDSIRFSPEDSLLIVRLLDKTLTTQYREVQLNRAIVLWKIENAHAMINAAPKIGGIKNVNQLNFYGIQHVLKQDYDKAVDMFKKAIELEPDNPILNVNLAFSLHLNKKKYKDILTKLDELKYNSSLVQYLRKENNK